MTIVKATDGVELYVEAHGDGIPIVLSCGYCTTHENWRGQVEPLVAAGARVVLWDYRGHGRSQSPRRPSAYSLDQVVSDLGRVLDWAAPDQPAVLGGHSFGGLASLHFTARHPQRVRALVLMASGPGFKNPEAAARWAAQVERTASVLESRGADAFVNGPAGATCVGNRPELPAARAAAAAVAAQDVAGLAAFGRFVAGPAEPVIDALPRLDVPALVVVGADDANYLRAGEVMAAKLPDARHHVLPDTGHVANIENPDAFNALVIEFLKNLGDGPKGAQPPS